MFGETQSWRMFISVQLQDCYRAFHYIEWYEVWLAGSAQPWWWNRYEPIEDEV